MTQVDPRKKLPELSPEEREAMLGVLERNRRRQQAMLERRGGEPVQLDDLLDELRGREQDGA